MSNTSSKPVRLRGPIGNSERIQNEGALYTSFHPIGNVGKKSEKEFLVPKFDEAVPAGGGDFGCFVGMPESGDANFLVGFKFRIQFGGFPVPNEKFSVGVAGNEISHIWRKVDATRVSGDHVTFERLLPVPFESV